MPVLGACLEEVIRSMTDTAYRNSLYSASYQWWKAVALLQKMELKKAFRHLMNLYGTDVEAGSFLGLTQATRIFPP